MLQIWYYPSAKKAKIISRKNILKDDISVIPEKYDIHPRKYGISVKIPYWLKFLIDILKRIPMTLGTFYKDLYRRFYILLSCEKKPPGKLNILDWNLTSSSIYMVGDILQWRIFNTLYLSTLRTHQLRKLFVH